MQESTCKHCGVKIYLDDQKQIGRGWSSGKFWYDWWCDFDNSSPQHEPVLTLEEKKKLLSAKEIMHRDLMQEIEDLRREIAKEELKKWIDSGGIG